MSTSTSAGAAAHFSKLAPSARCTRVGGGGWGAGRPGRPGRGRSNPSFIPAQDRKVKMPRHPPFGAAVTMSPGSFSCFSGPWELSAKPGGLQQGGRPKVEWGMDSFPRPGRGRVDTPETATQGHAAAAPGRPEKCQLVPTFPEARPVRASPAAVLWRLRSRLLHSRRGSWRGCSSDADTHPSCNPDPLPSSSHAHPGAAIPVLQMRMLSAQRTATCPNHHVSPSRLPWRPVTSNVLLLVCQLKSVPSTAARAGRGQPCGICDISQ